MSALAINDKMYMPTNVQNSIGSYLTGADLFSCDSSSIPRVVTDSLTDSLTEAPFRAEAIFNIIRT